MLECINTDRVCKIVPVNSNLFQSLIRSGYQPVKMTQEYYFTKIAVLPSREEMELFKEITRMSNLTSSAYCNLCHFHSKWTLKRKFPLKTIYTKCKIVFNFIIHKILYRTEGYMICQLKELFSGKSTLFVMFCATLRASSYAASEDSL